MYSFEKRTIAKYLSECEAKAEDEKGDGERRSVFPSRGEPPNRKVRTQMEGNCLNDNYGCEKNAMSSSQSGQVSTDNRTPKEVWLLATLGAECREDN